MITTGAQFQWPSHVAIRDYSAAGLNRQCVVRWKVFTLPNDHILKRAGRLVARDRRAVVSAASGIL
jgi:mRNA interferase MazF